MCYSCTVARSYNLRLIKTNFWSTYGPFCIWTKLVEIRTMLFYQGPYIDQEPLLLAVSISPEGLVTHPLRVRFSGRFVLLPTLRVSRSSIRAITTPPWLTKPSLGRHLTRQQAPQAFLTGKSGTKLPLLAPLHKGAYSKLLVSKKEYRRDRRGPLAVARSCQGLPEAF